MSFSLETHSHTISNISILSSKSMQVQMVGRHEEASFAP